MILNGFNLSAFCESYSPIIKPSFSFVDNAANRKRKLIDLGQSEDKFLCGLELILDASNYQIFTNIISSANGLLTCQTSLDLFFPGLFITTATVGIKQWQDSSFRDGLNVYRNVYLELILLQSLAFDETNTSAIQSILNRAQVETNNSSNYFAPTLYGSSYHFSQMPKLREVNLSCDIVTPYLAGQVLKWYLTNRTAEVSLLLSPRHHVDITTQTSVPVTISKLYTQRDENGFYNIDFVLTF